MANVLGWADAVCLVTFLFVNIGQSADSANVLGASCQNDLMCAISNSYCRPLTNTCECKSGHTHSTNKDSCIRLPEKAHIGSHCITDVDCAFTDEASRCSDNACRRCSEPSETEFAQCQDRIGGCSYHEYNGNCFKHRKIGEPCEMSEECWIFAGSDKSRNCSSSICQCVEGYDTMSGPLPPGQVDQCIKREAEGGASAASSFTMLVSLMLVPLLVSHWS